MRERPKIDPAAEREPPAGGPFMRLPYHPAMRRRFFTLLSALSLVLCVGTCVLWVRSYWIEDVIFLHRHRWSSGPVGTSNTWYTDDSESAGMFWDRGVLVFGSLRRRDTSMDPGAMTANPEGVGLLISHRPADGRWPGILADFGRGFIVRGMWLPSSGLDRRLHVGLPCWAAALSAGILPATRLAVLLRRRRQHRSAGASLCPACGYDLRATPHRCPECGAVLPAKKEISN